MEIIKSTHYTQDDYKFFLKRRIKNLGLLNKTIEIPNSAVDATYSLAVTENNLFAHVHVPGAYYYYRMDHAGNIVQNVTMGNFTTTAGAALYDNQYFSCRYINHLVYYIDADGNTISVGSSSGVGGAGNDQWNGPNDLEFDRSTGQLYIVDRGNHRVKVYDFGVNITTGSVSQASAIACDINGNIYVSSQGGDGVLVHIYSKNLVFQSSFSVGNPAVQIHGLHVDGDTIYISKNGDGLFTRSIATGSQSTVISGGVHWSVTTDNDYIYKTGANASVSRYTKSGVLVDTITIEAASSEAQHQLKLYDGYLFILLPTSGIVKKVSTDDFVATSLSNVIIGLTAGHIKYFDIDPKGLIYLSNYDDHQIEKYTNTGTAVSQWAAADLAGSMGIAFNPYTCQVVVCDFPVNQIRNYKFGLYKTKYEKSGGGAGTGDGEFTDPFSVTCSNNGNFYVLDLATSPKRIQKFTTAGVFVNSWSTISQARINYSPTENRIYDYNYTYSAVDGSNQRFMLYPTGTAASFWTKILNGNMYGLGAPGNRNIYVFDITPDYESTWMDVTKYVLSDNLVIKQTTDGNDFSLGKILLGDISFKVSNKNDKWAFENNADSIFFHEDELYQRNQSIFKIELSGNEIARYLIDGKNISNKEDFLEIKAYSPLKYLETILSTSLKGSIFNGNTISVILEKLINSRFFENIIEYNAADINIYYDAVIDDKESLPETTLDILVLLSKLGGFKFGLYNGYKFFANNIINPCKTHAIDYLVTENNLLEVDKFNNGEQRFFKSVEITCKKVEENVTMTPPDPSPSVTVSTYGNTTVTVTITKSGNTTVKRETEIKSVYTIPESVQVSFNEDRIIEIKADAITNYLTSQQAADNYQYFTTWPSKEITVKLPLLNYNLNLFSKIFGFNIFQKTRGIEFNTPSLNASTTALPTKTTATDGFGRLIYYVLEIEHHIGKSCFTILKLKEFIDDQV